MPVFDFSGSTDKKQESICTYTSFRSEETEATWERPMLILDNAKRQWKHHSCGIFTNQAKRTSFEFKEEDGTFEADILRVDARFISLLRWLGENHISVRLSGKNPETATPSTRSGRSHLAAGRSCRPRTDFLQFMIERLLAARRRRTSWQRTTRRNSVTT